MERAAAPREPTLSPPFFAPSDSTASRRSLWRQRRRQETTAFLFHSDFQLRLELTIPSNDTINSLKWKSRPPNHEKSQTGGPASKKSRQPLSIPKKPPAAWSSIGPKASAPKAPLKIS